MCRLRPCVNGSRAGMSMNNMVSGRHSTVYDTRGLAQTRICFSNAVGTHGNTGPECSRMRQPPSQGWVGRLACRLPGLAFLFVLAFLWPAAGALASSVTDLLNDGLQSHLAGDLNRAVEAYTEVLAKDSQNATAYNWRGSAYDDLGEHQKALEDLSKAVEIDNKYADAFNNRGEVFRKMGKLAEALKDYQTAARLDASFAEAHYNMALVYEAQNKKADAAREYRKYAELKPDAKDKEQVLSVAKALEAAPKGQPTPGAPGKGGQPGQMARPKPTKPGQQEVAEGGMTPSATGQQGQKPRSPRPGPTPRKLGAVTVASTPPVPPPFDQFMDAAQYKSLKPWLDTGQEWAPIAGIALVVFYVLDSLFLFLIARKTGTGPAILAFLPVFDTYLQFRIAEKPIWWFLLSIFVAPVAIIMYFIVCLGIANARGKSAIWGVLMYLPPTRPIALAYLGLTR